jgi:protein-disulfide isomerase
MSMKQWAVVAFLLCGAAYGAEATPPEPISSNPADSPVRVKSGKVFASSDATLPPALGPLPAKVLVTVFSDFQCPVCRRSADATQQIAEEFPGEVRVEFWQHPLAIHSRAEDVAVAALAAQRQGMFWEFHDEVFRNQDAIDPASLERYAERIGLDVARFKDDCASPELRARVKTEAAAAGRLGARNTPAFMINGKLKTGWGSWSGFKADVQRELADARRLEEQGTPIEQIVERRAEAQIADAELLAAYRELVLRIAPAVAAKGKLKKT